MRDVKHELSEARSLQPNVYPESELLEGSPAISSAMPHRLGAWPRPSVTAIAYRMQRSLYKPRFYPPPDAADCDWGWKRRCEDFQPRLELAPPGVPAIPRAGRG